MRYFGGPYIAGLFASTSQLYTWRLRLGLDPFTHGNPPTSLLRPAPPGSPGRLQTCTALQANQSSLQRSRKTGRICPAATVSRLRVGRYRSRAATPRLHLHSSLIAVALSRRPCDKLTEGSDTRSMRCTAVAIAYLWLHSADALACVGQRSLAGVSMR